MQQNQVDGWDAEGDDFGESDHRDKWLTFVDGLICVN